jgi:hypothetical protein
MANVNLNTNFNKFVDWAKKFDANSSEIAKASNMIGDGLAVDSKRGDGVGFFAKLRRGADHKDINNTTRALFLDAVKEMFGGESKIPQSVKDAMRFSNFSNATTGKPLTARRIHAVKVAIDEFVANSGGKPVDSSSPAEKGVRLMTEASKIKESEVAEMKPIKKLSVQQVQSMVAGSVSLLGAEGRLSEEMRGVCEMLLREYGRNMPAKNLRVLSNYIVNQALSNNLDEEDVMSIAQDIKTWRDFSFHDPRMTSLGAKFAQRINDTLAEYRNTANWCLNDDPANPLQKHVAEQFMKDAESFTWNMDGTEIGALSDAKQVQQYKQQVMDKMLDAIKNKVKDADRQPIVAFAFSTILNQLIFSDIMAVIYKKPATVGNAVDPAASETLHTMPGGNLFVSTNTDNRIGGNVADYAKSFDIEISDDGKSATITCELDEHITSMCSASKESRIGKMTVGEKITIDLIKPMPTVTDVTFSQKFTPDETYDSARAIEFWA